MIGRGGPACGQDGGLEQVDPSCIPGEECGGEELILWTCYGTEQELSPVPEKDAELFEAGIHFFFCMGGPVLITPLEKREDLAKIRIGNILKGGPGGFFQVLHEVFFVVAGQGFVWGVEGQDEIDLR